jgi:hypothetical protein
MDVLNSSFDNEYCSGTIIFITRRDLHVQMRLKNMAVGRQLFWWAAAPPGFGISLSGSGMPYSNAIQAYDNTVNKGVLTVDASNSIAFDMKYPNAYYIGLGSLYIAPHINFKLTSVDGPETQWVVPVDNGIPFRMLTYPTGQGTIPRNSCMFYDDQPYGARSQEEILRASEYPATHSMPANFWGLRPTR